MKGFSAILALIIGLIVGAGIGLAVANSQPKTSKTVLTPNPKISTAQISIKESELKMDMRKLWEDHITWTRMYIVSVANNNPDSKNVAARLLKNQEDLGNAIKPVYGNEAGNKLTTLLKEHINGAVALISAAKSGDQKALTEANDRWYKNGDNIADFLSSANPNWPKTETRAMMKEHLDLTKQEAVDILNKNFDAGISDYDLVHDQILKMSDMLSMGVIKQFPDKF